jgi:hypothetical protein
MTKWRMFQYVRIKIKLSLNLGNGTGVDDDDDDDCFIVEYLATTAGCVIDRLWDVRDNFHRAVLDVSREDPPTIVAGP